MFGKRKAREEEPPVPGVDWVDVRRFTIGRTERSVIHGRKPKTGRLAVRVPRKSGEVRTFAPCAYFRTDTPSTPVMDPTLFEDEAAQVLLCSVDGPVEVEREIHRSVRDGAGRVIGTIRRVPSAHRLVHHTWRIDQPGRPEIAGRNQWSLANNGGAKGLAMRGLESALNTALEVAGGGDTRAAQGRTLEWRAEDELVMVSKGRPEMDSSVDVSIKVGWLDRRLAFAVAMVADFPDL